MFPTVSLQWCWTSSFCWSTSREVHRALNRAAGLHHQSTSSNSAVPTVMLLTNSLIYVLISGTWSMLFLVSCFHYSAVVEQCLLIAAAITRLVFDYNFFIYFITGKQFRSELHKLFFGVCSSAAAAAVAGDNNYDDRVTRHSQINTAISTI